MKKIIILTLLIFLGCSGCKNKGSENVIKDFENKVNNAKSYTLKGNMEIYSDEETFTYSIEADYLKDNFYKVTMVNQTNNHEQILLRNKDAVYVITPSLNKSFKFQSEWPDNSSQSYLLKPILKDITNDANKTVEKQDNTNIIKSVVNYPNNPELKYQKITITEDGTIKKNEIYDENDNLKIKVIFTSVDYNSSLEEQDFALEKYIENNEEPKSNNSNNPNTDSSKNQTDDNNQNDTQNQTDANQNNSNSKNKTTCTEETCKETDSCSNGNCEQTGLLEDIMYPLYIPSNTYLSTSDKVDTDTGNRVILTFGGEKSFVLVEEKAVASDQFEIIPVYGDPLIVNDTLGALGANSLTWTKDNISYYLAGNDLTTAELLSIGQSIRSENITVSQEK